MNAVKLKINGTDIEADAGASILDAARSAGISVPSLCYLKDVNCVGACRMCIVEVKGRNALVPACSTKVAEGMEVQTSTPEIERVRKQNLELICSNHRQDCSRCTRFPYCELHTLCRQYGIDDRQNMFNRKEEVTDSFVHLERDHSKCILCRRCVSMCRKIQGISAISVLGRGFSAKVSSAFGAETACVNCGQCISVCPTAALSEKNDTRTVGVMLSQNKKHVVAVVSGAAAAQLGEYFGDEIGAETSKGKTAAALRRLGFKAVFDADQAAASMVYERCAELLRRVQSHGSPLISAACPSVKKYCKANFPELVENLSSPESPIQAAAAACRSNYAREHHVDTEEVSVVTISSCTADKYERSLPGYSDWISAAITTHEVYLLFERACISSYSARQVWDSIPEESFETGPYGAEPFAAGTLTQALSQLGAVCVDAPHALPENHAIMEAGYTYNGIPFKAAYATGMKATKQLLAEVRNGTSHYALVEAFACPGGCMYGAGRSRQFSGSRPLVYCKEGEL